MTAPRQVLPGSSYSISRRCAQRQFLLRPSKYTTDAFLFVLAVVAQRYGVEVHAYCVMSNHFHLIVTDPFARIPEFVRDLDAFVARAVNASLGRWEAFWAPGSYSAVKLASPDAIVDQTAYALANPVAAGLVRCADQWPGAWSAPARFGAGGIEVERPAGFFASDGAFPEKASLELAIPPGFESADEFRDQVIARLREREKAAQDRIGGGFVGVRRVLKQDPLARPTSREPRRNLKPRVAARDTLTRIRALAELAEFKRAYRIAWAARRAGTTDVVFPAGTYQLRILHGVRCVGFGGAA